jgi:hypothetical protein
MRFELVAAPEGGRAVSEFGVLAIGVGSSGRLRTRRSEPGTCGALGLGEPIPVSCPRAKAPSGAQRQSRPTFRRQGTAGADFSYCTGDPTAAPSFSPRDAGTGAGDLLRRGALARGEETGVVVAGTGAPIGPPRAPTDECVGAPKEQSPAPAPKMIPTFRSSVGVRYRRLAWTS